MFTTFLQLILVSQLGVNLNSVSDYSPEIAFADAIKSSRCVGSFTAAYDCKFGSNIPAAGEFAILVHTAVPGLEGTYSLSYTGQADVSFPASSAQLQNVKYDAAKNLSTADVVLAKDSQLYIAFRPKTPVSNISLLRPGTKSGDEFNPVFTNFIKPYSTIRFMDWLHTNSNPIKSWADRKLPTDLIQSGVKGVAIEYAIDLANLTSKDAWLNIPLQVDDDYVVNMAKLIKDKLKQELKVYIELSNELWNTAPDFKQSIQNHDLAVAEVKAGAVDLQDGNAADTNDWYWARRRVAKRTGRISDIFRDVFGADQINKRVRIILGAHAADHSKARVELAYMQKYNGPVSSKIYAIATAPYFANTNYLQKDANKKLILDANGNPILVEGATVDTNLNGLEGSVASWTNDIWPCRRDWDGKSQDVNHCEYAKYYGIKHVAYEGGVHQNGTVGESLNRAAMLHPRMGGIYETYLRNFFKASPLNVMFMQFSDISTWDKNGYWGATFDYRVGTPKVDAILKVAADLNKPSVPTDPAQDQIKLLQAQIQILTGKVTLMQADIDAKAKQIDASQTDLKNAQGVNANQQKQISDLTAALKEKSDLVLALDSATVNLQKQIDGQGAKLSETKSVLTDLIKTLQ
jgi:hypothetical protein